MMTRFSSLALLLAVAWTPAKLDAQSVGVEAGLAGIENYDPFTPSLGASLHIPVAERLSVSATYARWTGRDGNESAFAPPGVSRFGYGNQAFLITGLVRILGSEGLTTSLGAGAGWFQHFTAVGGEAETHYDSTPVGTLVVRYPLNNRLAPYLRADVQIPSEPVVHYGLVRLGVDIQLR